MRRTRFMICLHCFWPLPALRRPFSPTTVSVAQVVSASFSQQWQRTNEIVTASEWCSGACSMYSAGSAGSPGSAESRRHGCHELRCRRLLKSPAVRANSWGNTDFSRCHPQILNRQSRGQSISLNCNCNFPLRLLFPHKRESHRRMKSFP